MASFRQQVLRGFNRRVLVIFEHDIDANDEMRQGVKPGEPGVVHDELQELPGRGDASVNAFIRELFGDDQGLVQAEEAVAEVLEAATKIVRNRIRRRPGGTCHRSPILPNPQLQATAVPTTGMMPSAGPLSVLRGYCIGWFAQGLSPRPVEQKKFFLALPRRPETGMIFPLEDEVLNDTMHITGACT